MPRASWRGFLRLSLVSCPVYLSPATTHTKSIRLHQVWRPPQPEELKEELRDKGQNAEIARAPRRAEPTMTMALARIRAGQLGALHCGLTIPEPGKSSRKARSSRVTNTSASNSSRSLETS
jgi:hypothetical protein